MCILQVTWTFLDSRNGGEIISNDESIFISNYDCKEGKKKYEITRREVNRRITYMLTVNCLEMVDYGYYKCYINIGGTGSNMWPSKIGYLVVQGKIINFMVIIAIAEPDY